MTREIIKPTDEAHWLEMRTRDITSTDVGALFGISPYITLFELWYRKKEGTVVDFTENDRMKWGNRLEAAIAQGIAEDNGWTVRPMKDYIRGSELKVGASFDWEIMLNNDSTPVATKAILEIKNVDGLIFKQSWIKNDAGALEAPLHIEIQVQHQLLVSGYDHAYIGALVGGNEIQLLHRKRNEVVIQAIKTKVAEFWKSIEENKPPEPDFMTDSSFINSLYGYSEPGKFIDIADDDMLRQLAVRYKEYAQQEKEAKAGKSAIKAEFLTKIGDAEKCAGDGFSISAGTVSPSWIEAYERKGYRGFRVNWKKGA